MALHLMCSPWSFNLQAFQRIIWLSILGTVLITIACEPINHMASQGLSCRRARHKVCSSLALLFSFTRNIIVIVIVANNRRKKNPDLSIGIVPRTGVEPVRV